MSDADEESGDAFMKSFEAVTLKQRLQRQTSMDDVSSLSSSSSSTKSTPSLLQSQPDDSSWVVISVDQSLPSNQGESAKRSGGETVPMIRRPKPPPPLKPKPKLPTTKFPKPKPKSPTTKFTEEVSSNQNIDAKVAKPFGQIKAPAERAKSFSDYDEIKTNETDGKSSTSSSPSAVKSLKAVFDVTPQGSQTYAKHYLSKRELENATLEKTVSVIKQQKEEDHIANEVPSSIPERKTFSDYKEIKTNETEGKNSTSSSPSAVKSLKAVFDVTVQGSYIYAKPDLSKREPKSVTLEKTVSATKLQKEEDSSTNEVPPPIPERGYSEEDIAGGPLTPPVTMRDIGDSSRRELTGDQSLTQPNMALAERPYEDVSVPDFKTPPLPVPPSAFRDRQLPSNSGFDSLQVDPPSPPTEITNSDQTQASNGISRVTDGSLHSEVENHIDVNPYSTVDVVTHLPTMDRQSSGKQVLQPPPKPRPYHLKGKEENLSQPQTSSPQSQLAQTNVRKPPPKPLPYQPKPVEETGPSLETSLNKRKRKDNDVTEYALPFETGRDVSLGKKAADRQKPLAQTASLCSLDSLSGEPPANLERSSSQKSPVSPGSTEIPVVIAESPKRASAQVVPNLSPPSASLSSSLDKPPKLKPPPPPRISSMTDQPQKDQADASSQKTLNYAGGNRGVSSIPVNGLLDDYTSLDEIGIPTRDPGATLHSKPALPIKPGQKIAPDPGQNSLARSRQSHAVEHHGPPNFKPPPPPKLMHSFPVSKPFGEQSGSGKSAREGNESSSSIALFGLIAPPPEDWYDHRSERSESTTSRDSLDVKIVPPPPIDEDLNRSSDSPPVNLAREVKPVLPSSGSVKEPVRVRWDSGKSTPRAGTPNTGFRNKLQKSALSTDYDIPIVPPPPPSSSPPTFPVSGPIFYEMDLEPSQLSDDIGERTMHDILEVFDQTLSVQPERGDGASDEEDFLPPPPLPPGRYSAIPPPPANERIKPFVPPLRKQR